MPTEASAGVSRKATIASVESGQEGAHSEPQNPATPTPPSGEVSTEPLDRRTYIGSSDAAMVANLSPWGSPLTVWNRLAGLEVEDRSNLRMWLGKQLEPIVLELYRQRTGHLPDKIGNDEGPPILSSEHPFIGTHVDYDHVEIKTSRSRHGWGEDETVATVDEMVIPLHYFLQFQHVLYVMGWHALEVAVLIGHDEFRTYTVPADAKVIERLVAAEAELWEWAQAGTPPVMDDHDSRRAYLRARFPRQLTPPRPATPEDELLIAAWLVAKQELVRAKAAEELAKDRLAKAIGHSEGFEGLVSWKAQGRSDIDAAKLRELLRAIGRLDIVEQATKRTTFRVMRYLRTEDD